MLQLRWECLVFQPDELCTNHKNTPYIFTILYLILIHLWNESTYKIHLLLQVWNKIIADNEHKLGKLGESKFIHMTVNEGDCNVYAHSSLWMRPTRPDWYNAKMVYTLWKFFFTNLWNLAKPVLFYYTCKYCHFVINVLNYMWLTVNIFVLPGHCALVVIICSVVLLTWYVIILYRSESSNPFMIVCHPWCAMNVFDQGFQLISPIWFCTCGTSWSSCCQ